MIETKLIAVIAVLLIIFLSIIVYLFTLDNKIKKLKRKIELKENSDEE